MSTNADIPPNNGAILNIGQIIKSVMSSAAESELGGIFINAKESAHLRNILTEMGHPQPPTPTKTENSTANGVITTIFNLNKQRKWTCGLTGSWTERQDFNSGSIGVQALATWQITGPRTTVPSTITMYDKSTSPQKKR